MFYLSDDIYVQRNFYTLAPVGSRLEFRVEIADLSSSDYETIYNGLITVFNKTQRIYLNDIIATNMYRHNYITPQTSIDGVGNIVGRTETQMDAAKSIVSVRVVFPSINLSIYVSPVVQYYKDVNMPRVDLGHIEQSSLYSMHNLLDLRPVNVLPHIPALDKATYNFWFGCLIAKSNGVVEDFGDEWTFHNDTDIEIYAYPPRSTTTAINLTGSGLYDLCSKNVIDRDQHLSMYVFGDDDECSLTVATIDHCPSRYYLIWMDRTGAYQCQRFNKKVIHSENITNTYIVNYLDETRPAVKEVKDAWVVNSDWLTEQEYKCYESIFVSPYLYLYDTQTDEGYWVNITNKSWTEKTKQNNKKPYNLTLNLESNRSQKIVY